MDMWQAKYNASNDSWSASDIIDHDHQRLGSRLRGRPIVSRRGCGGIRSAGRCAPPRGDRRGSNPTRAGADDSGHEVGLYCLSGHRHDGKSSNASAIPEGAQIQLDPSFNVAAQSWAPWQKTIAVALQQYGAFVNDTGGSLALYGVNDINQGNVTWASVGMAKSPSLSWIPWSQMRVLTHGEVRQLSSH